MKIAAIISFLESLAHPTLQESYDNAGLITGDADWECKGVLVSLDATEEVVTEAIRRKCNCIVAHHPIVFTGLKKIDPGHYVGKTIITAIKNDIAIYAIHTNLDNVVHGVSGRMAALLGLKNVRVLAIKENTLRKLFTFVPVEKAGGVRAAIFAAGAGSIGNYSECSFNTEGTGTFKAGTGTDPYVGEKGKQHQEKEIKLEAIFPAYLEKQVVAALKEAHPYEEVAFDIVPLSNTWESVGSGVVGEMEEEMQASQFLQKLRDIFGTPVVRHSPVPDQKIRKVAVCGGAGAFLIKKALSVGAQAFVTSDLKYHEFFEANGKLLLADIGHFESEQFTIDLLKEVLEQKFPNFAVLKTGVMTNPVHYFGS